MEKFALIVAGGTGKRMGNALAKQFIEIAGKPILMHTLRVFHSLDEAIRIILVIPESQEKNWSELCRKHHFDIPHRVVSGGETRFHSVKNGLEYVSEGSIVFIHDGVRPLVSHETIIRCYEEALRSGNAIPVRFAGESVRWVENGKSFPVDRQKLALVQTPQTFRADLIKAAYRQEYSPHFTDDATVLESTGEEIRLVEGNRENIKITWPEDLMVARIILEKG